MKEIIEICVDTLYKISKPTVNKTNFLKLLNFAIFGVEFNFNSLIYSQQDGIAMGSPLGPTLTNIFMGYIELKAVPAF